MVALTLLMLYKGIHRYGHNDYIGSVPLTTDGLCPMVIRDKQTIVTKNRKYTYDFPMAAVTVDGVLFGFDPKDRDFPLQVLMVIRDDEPFKGWWALPGGYVEVGKNESLDAAVRREVEEETGASVSYLEQLYTFGEPNRDPRGRVISVAYFALVRKEDHAVGGKRSDARDSAWITIEATQKLRLSIAFDHLDILKMALTRLQAKVRYAPIGFNLLPQKFSLGDLQQLYEAILQKKLNRSNFRRRILAMEILTEVGNTAGMKRSGPVAKLYKFDKRAYDQAVKNGFNFEI